ncbi:hypothetical protein OIV83_003311 [Microbotryomycetes sp. JL201]|nr:hypothetical protein OIV83_003311 [Microbotryomycetes sp. JL201]
MAALLRCAPKQQRSVAPMLGRRALCSQTATCTPRSTAFLRSYRLTLAASLSTAALGFGALPISSPLLCASDRSYAAPQPVTTNKPLPVAESSINVRDLGFGTISGICVGIFIKKGLKYMSSRSFVTVNWNAVSSTYDSIVTKHAGPDATKSGNRLAGVTNTFVDFVTANVQSRATFVLGMMLGLRLG